MRVDQKPTLAALLLAMILASGAGAAASDEEIGVASTRRNFYFVLDGSGSMRGQPDGTCKRDGRFANKLEGAKWAVQQFMQLVPDDVNLGLWVFDRGDPKGREVVALGPNNRETFLDAVDKIRAGGKTPLARAMISGVDQLVAQEKRQLGYGEYRLVIVTDGQAEELPQAARHADRYGIPIYTIGLCIGNAHALRQHSVSYRAADSMDDLRRGLEATLAETEAFDDTAFQTIK